MVAKKTKKPAEKRSPEQDEREREKRVPTVTLDGKPAKRFANEQERRAHDEKMSKYLTPETLFRRSNFERYMGELDD